MKLILQYTHQPDYQFPHWVECHMKPFEDDFTTTMDVNEWLGERLGDLGNLWGFERKIDDSRAPVGLNPVKVKLFYTDLIISWRFKEKEDAMMFKLRWHDA